MYRQRSIYIAGPALARHVSSKELTMSRLQLALNVTDLEAAIQHYTTLFGAAPAKIKPGYANFAIAQPPLKLVLIENPEAENGSINHLGVEVETREEVAGEHQRLTAAGVDSVVEGETTCCFAVQDKFWVQGGPTLFEVYTVLAPADSMYPTDSACCTPATVEAEAVEAAGADTVSVGRCC
jgi:catechol 2,3-dioxygenase-like lactoylglutathione lyase family enzyme